LGLLARDLDRLGQLIGQPADQAVGFVLLIASGARRCDSERKAQEQNNAGGRKPAPPELWSEPKASELEIRSGDSSKLTALRPS